MSLTNCEINFDLNWSKKCVIVATDVANQASTFSISDTKFYALVVNLSTQDNAKLPEQLECFFKTTINWDKHQSKISRERPNQYLDYLIDPSFQGVNRHFVLSFENNAHKKSHKRYFFPIVEVKYYNFMIDGKSFFDQPVKNNLRTYDSI